MWVILYGGFVEGVQGAVGPFESEEGADDYADGHNLGHYEKCTIKLEIPEDN